MSLDRELHIAAFAGSIRRDSINQQLLDVAVQAVMDAGATVDLLSLAEFPMPMYNADLQAERGIPASTAAFVERVQRAHAILIASPEYNGGYSPLLKNTIDWASRIDRRLFLPRLVGLMSASPGSNGGIRGLAQLEQLFLNIRATVLEPSFSLGDFKERFLDGTLVDLDAAGRLERWAKEYVRAAATQAADPPQPPG